MIRSQAFADQLCFFYQNVPKTDNKKQNYVSQWLFTLLGDESAVTPDQREFPVITKKIREEIIGTHKRNFFRRSSFYMCLKGNGF